MVNPSKFLYTHHYHRCACGTRWGHDLPDMATVSTEEYHGRHNCPSCGTNIRKIDGYLTEDDALGFAAETGNPLAQALAKRR